MCTCTCVCSIYYYFLQGGHEKIVKAPVTKCDMGTQTDVHFLESNIVQSYVWNEWELRRKAIKLVFHSRF